MKNIIIGIVIGVALSGVVTASSFVLGSYIDMEKSRLTMMSHRPENTGEAHLYNISVSLKRIADHYDKRR